MGKKRRKKKKNLFPHQTYKELKNFVWILSSPRERTNDIDNAGFPTSFQPDHPTMQFAVNTLYEYVLRVSK